MTLPIPNPFGTVSTQKLKSQWTNNLQANTYVAPYGLMFFDTYDGVLRLGDGSTPGGQIINTGGGGNGVPGGANTQIQFNNGGVFGGNIALTFDAANSVLNLTGLANITGNVTATDTITAGNVTATDTITAGNAVAANLVTAENALFLNANVVSQNYTIPPGYNALSAGPITIPDGITVDSAGSNWGIV